MIDMTSHTTLNNLGTPASVFINHSPLVEPDGRCESIAYRRIAAFGLDLNLKVKLGFCPYAHPEPVMGEAGRYPLDRPSLSWPGEGVPAWSSVV